MGRSSVTCSVDKASVVLERAFEDWISHPEKWCQRSYGRGREGRELDFLDESSRAEAVEVCALGAIYLVLDCKPTDEKSRPARLYLKRAAEELFAYPYATPIWVNDCLGYYAVCRMYARAIELAKAEGN